MQQGLEFATWMESLVSVLNTHFSMSVGETNHTEEWFRSKYSEDLDPLDVADIIAQEKGIPYIPLSQVPEILDNYMEGIEGA